MRSQLDDGKCANAKEMQSLSKLLDSEKVKSSMLDNELLKSKEKNLILLQSVEEVKTDHSILFNISNRKVQNLA